MIGPENFFGSKCVNVSFYEIAYAPLQGIIVGIGIKTVRRQALLLLSVEKLSSLDLNYST